MAYPSGIEIISKGACPFKAGSPSVCMFCSYGHMLECHYPKTCEQANCSHYANDNEIEHLISGDFLDETDY